MSKNKLFGIGFLLLGVITLVGILVNNISYAEDNITLRINNTLENDTTTTTVDKSKFILISSDNKIIRSFSIGINTGYIDISNLGPGNYTLYNTYSPDNYKILDPATITINSDSNLQTYTVNNEASNQIKLIIQNIDPGIEDYIGGSTFDIYSGTEKVSSCTTKDHLPCIITNLASGEYTIKESVTPPGYFKLEDQSFTIDTNFEGKTKTVAFERSYTKVEICKLNSNTSKNIAGASLELYDINNKLIDSWTSDEYVHLIERIPFGEYYLVETSAPAGYEKTTETKTIMVDENTTIVHVVFENNPTITTEDTLSSTSILTIVLCVSSLVIGSILMFSIKEKNE